jgi:hypothetical protein
MGELDMPLHVRSIHESPLADVANFFFSEMFWWRVSILLSFTKLLHYKGKIRKDNFGVSFVIKFGSLVRLLLVGAVVNLAFV